ncbi:MAG: CinA family protein [Oscillospiraceae bacterium]|nr:CinA family protein [Oscillospiraceae bacterium]
MDEAKVVVSRLTARNRTLATAESCTGGLLGKLITDVPGASAVYLGGVISYAYAVKTALLGVDAALLEEKGAVCEEVAVQMAEGVRSLLHADFALAATGNAGPRADPKNPNVGEIYIACATDDQTLCRRLTLCGGREENRRETCLEALRLLEEACRG